MAVARAIGAGRAQRVAELLHEKRGRPGKKDRGHEVGPEKHEHEEHGRADEPRGAEQKEPGPPGIPFRKHGSQPAAEDRADGDARLMKRERPASCGRPVVVGRERHRGRKIKRLADTFRRPHRHEMPRTATNCHELPELRAPGRGDGYEAPEDAAAQNQVHPLHAVGDEPREGGAPRIDPHEGRTD